MTQILRNFDNESLKDKSYSASDYFNLPEGAPYQLIEGDLIMSPSPKRLHQALLMSLADSVYNHVKKNNSGYVYPSPIDVYLDDKNAYQPDIVFVSKENSSILREGGIDGAPDLVVEILSSSSKDYDAIRKKAVYERTGVKEYIIVDPDNKTVESFINNESKKFTQFQKQDYKKNGGKFLIKTLSLEIDLGELSKAE
ncbi:MAG: Uma2 family endonuclease [Deltaproteobacteria bacterium]|nr:Uma2 family endonuclease [Deltaproteobacteria bacterium]